MSVRFGPLRARVFGALALALLTSACGRHRAAAPVPRPISPGPSVPAGPGTMEVGYASWYGDPYHGRRAANGEIYDKNQMTAAHRTLPFETMVKVTNLENNRSTQVRITDRGPFVEGRVIDLSFAAASQIAMIGPGTALVRLEVLPSSQNTAAPSAAAHYVVQVGAFQERVTAERLEKQLASRYGNAYIEDFHSEAGLLYRVRVGPRASLWEAQRLAIQLQNDRLSTFVVRLGP